MACSAGLNRSMWPTAPTSPADSNASVILVAASRVWANGFSTNVGIPASASRIATCS